MGQGTVRDPDAEYLFQYRNEGRGLKLLRKVTTADRQEKRVSNSEGRDSLDKLSRPGVLQVG